MAALMLHARIAARAFNTPLLVEPSKAMAFLSGLGPRILGRQVEVSDGDMAEASISAAQPTRANLLAGGLADRLRQYGDTPYPVVDGIAVIEIAGVLVQASISMLHLSVPCRFTWRWLAESRTTWGCARRRDTSLCLLR